MVLTVTEMIVDIFEMFGKCYYNFVKELSFFDRVFGYCSFYFGIFGIICKFFGLRIFF